MGLKGLNNLQQRAGMNAANNDKLKFLGGFRSLGFMQGNICIAVHDLLVNVFGLESLTRMRGSISTGDSEKIVLP